MMISQWLPRQANSCAGCGGSIEPQELYSKWLSAVNAALSEGIDLKSCWFNWYGARQRLLNAGWISGGNLEVDEKTGEMHLSSCDLPSADNERKCGR